MAGEIVSLFRAKRFDFSQVEANGNGFVVGPMVDLLRFRRAALLLRLNEVDIGPGASMEVAVFPTAPSQRDPGAWFLDTTTDASVSLAGASSGSLLRIVIPLEIFGAAVQVAVFGSQSPSGSQTIYARLSAGLLGRR